jgi:hypothetical protein
MFRQLYAVRLFVIFCRIAGSSHVYFGINSIVVWKEKWIKSFVIGGPAAPLWKEALKK